MTRPSGSDLPRGLAQETALQAGRDRVPRPPPGCSRAGPRCPAWRAEGTRHVSTLGRAGTTTSASWTGALTEWALRDAPSRAERAEALAVARQHRDEWLPGPLGASSASRSSSSTTPGPDRTSQPHREEDRDPDVHRLLPGVLAVGRRLQRLLRPKPCADERVGYQVESVRWYAPARRTPCRVRRPPELLVEVAGHQPAGEPVGTVDGGRERCQEAQGGTAPATKDRSGRRTRWTAASVASRSGMSISASWQVTRSNAPSGSSASCCASDSR